MRVGGAGQGGYGLVPFGAGSAQRRREAVEPPEPVNAARPDIQPPFSTARHPFLRVEPVGYQRRGQAFAGEAVEAAPPSPSVPFLAQFIAQQNAREGLELDRAKDGASAYRRAEIPAVAIRAGANIDTAA